jgi:hypothetical protein
MDDMMAAMEVMMGSIDGLAGSGRGPTSRMTDKGLKMGSRGRKKAAKVPVARPKPAALRPAATRPAAPSKPSGAGAVPPRKKVRTAGPPAGPPALRRRA